MACFQSGTGLSYASSYPCCLGVCSMIAAICFLVLALSGARPRTAMRSASLTLSDGTTCSKTAQNWSSNSAVVGFVGVAVCGAGRLWQDISLTPCSETFSEPIANGRPTVSMLYKVPLAARTLPTGPPRSGLSSNFATVSAIAWCICDGADVFQSKPIGKVRTMSISEGASSRNGC